MNENSKPKDAISINNNDNISKKNNIVNNPKNANSKYFFI